MASGFPREHLAIAPAEFRPHDLTEPLDSCGPFDLAVSLEVAEHLPESHAPNSIASLTELAPLVLFSAAIPHQGGTHHVNEQWPEYWSSLFRERGFRVIDCIRPQIWNNEDIPYWYRQNTLLFADSRALHSHPRLSHALQQTNESMLAVVHPRRFEKLARQRDRLQQRG